MNPQLAIRPGWNDHLVVEDLLAPGGSGRRPGANPVIDRLVIDASIALREPRYTEAAASAGVPIIVDPQTFLVPSRVDPSNAWARLKFGVSRPVPKSAIIDYLNEGTFVEDVIEYQIEHGATAIAPPYFHSQSEDDPGFTATHYAMYLTHRVMEREGIDLPILPVLSARLDRFSTPEAQRESLSHFADDALLYGAREVAFILGPSGNANDSYARVHGLFSVVDALRSYGLNVLPLRQGLHGFALAAIGAIGYETGIDAGEGTNVSSLQSSRSRPPQPPDPDRRTGGRARRVYVDSLGLLLPQSVTDAIHQSRSARALLVCDDDVNCCPDGYTSTLADRRSHAIRSRARELRILKRVPPNRLWRLNLVAVRADEKRRNIEVANRALRTAGLAPLSVGAFESEARVAEFLATHASEAAS